MTPPITALGSRYGIQGALGRSVKRASTGAWSPTDISGCKLWFDFSDSDTLFTDAGSTKVSSDGDAIYQANDKSGNGFNGTQSTAGYRPLYKTNIKNGKSVAFFDDTDDKLLFDYVLGTSTDFTTFVVFDCLSLRNYTNFMGGRTSFYKVITIQIQANGAVLTGTDTTGRIITSGGYLAANNYYLYMLKKDGSSAGNLTLMKNGANAAVNTGATAPSPLSSYGGHVLSFGGYTINGYVCELIIYDSALSDTDRGTVETYLNNKWAIYS